MDDAEYLFMQTSRERKQAGRGDYCKKRRGGRGVRLPSDHLTEKQRKKLNGKVMTYDYSKPVDYREFKKWPDEHKAAYIRHLEKKYGAGNVQIAEMFGVNKATISATRKSLGISGIRGKHTKLDAEAWSAFLRGGGDVEKMVEAVAKVPVMALPLSEIEEKAPEEAKRSADVNNIAVLLQALAGTGAKITIELTL